METNRQAGFTLFELIITISVIGLLTTAVMGASFVGSQAQARDTRRRADLRKIQLALEEYYVDHNQYPPDDNEGRIRLCGPGFNQPCDWGTDAFEDSNGTVYLDELPADSNDSLTYYYRVFEGSRNGFTLWSALERDDGDGTESCGGIQDAPVCGNTHPDTGSPFCQYGVSSPNSGVFCWNITECPWGQTYNEPGCS